ncbi:MAG: methyltransferase domain-containing protein [Gemmatimonadota bacterium]
MSLRLRTNCRICSADTRTFLELGVQPLANRLPPAGEEATTPRFPLTMARCQDCGLVQLREVVDSSLLFSDYAYVPSTSSTMRSHFSSLADDVISRMRLAPGDLVVDIGSNDGLLLSFFRDAGIRVQGIEMAANLAQRASLAGIPTVAAPLTAESAAGVRAASGPARVACATNVFAHVDDVRSFLRSALTLLDEDGAFIIEVQSFAETAQWLAFDMTYHEHLSYYTTAALQRLCQLEGVALLDVEVVGTHGGSLRATIGRHGHHLARPERVAERVAAEAPLVNDEGCRKFADGALRLKNDLRSLITELRAKGKVVAGYGAPAKATVLLNFCGFGRRDISWIIDRNPDKQGRVIPGTGIPVVGPGMLTEDPPTHLLLLAWNLADEIIEEQRDWRESGGRFVRPLPVPAVLA